MKSIKAVVVTSILVGLAASGCAATPVPPAELVNARTEMARAKQSSAAQLDPTDIHAAEVALSRAERAFADEPESSMTADLAAIAQLKAMSAEAAGATLLANMQAAQAQKEMQESQAAQLKDAKGDLRQTQGNLNSTREQLEREKQETDKEHTKRVEAEQQLKNARDTLARIAQVKEDDRGMVVTFQGEALFKTAKADLLPSAMAKLDQVAETLKGRERRILIVGHTDNQGGPGQYNQDLSERRAATVRDYLISKGLPADTVRAEGRGPGQPVAENTSIEGRAANRRVEIIVEPKR